MAPQAGCTATPAQLEANKKVAMAFFAPDADRVALADPSYKQHNPAFVKGGKEAGLSDFDYFKSRFGGPRQGGPGPAQVAVRRQRVLNLRRAIHSRSSWPSATW